MTWNTLYVGIAYFFASLPFWFFGYLINLWAIEERNFLFRAPLLLRLASLVFRPDQKLEAIGVMLQLLGSAMFFPGIYLLATDADPVIRGRVIGFTFLGGSVIVGTVNKILEKIYGK